MKIACERCLRVVDANSREIKQWTHIFRYEGNIPQGNEYLCPECAEAYYQFIHKKSPKKNDHDYDVIRPCDQTTPMQKGWSNEED